MALRLMPDCPKQTIGQNGHRTGQISTARLRTLTAFACTAARRGGMPWAACSDQAVAAVLTAAESSSCRRVKDSQEMVSPVVVVAVLAVVVALHCHVAWTGLVMMSDFPWYAPSAQSNESLRWGRLFFARSEYRGGWARAECLEHHIIGVVP